MIPAVEHVGELRSEPEPFGLSPKDVAGTSLPQLKKIAIGLIREGWTRFRFIDGCYRFEICRLDDRTRALMVGVLRKCGVVPREQISISVLDPLAEHECDAARFLADGSGMRPTDVRRNAWRFSR